MRDSRHHVAVATSPGYTDTSDQHVQTVKDLRDLQAAIAQPYEIPAESDIHYRHYMFDERNTILLDDSTAKAVHQPWNHICLPEYDHAEHRASQVWALRHQGRVSPGESGSGSGIDVDIIERKKSAKGKQAGELDEYLLCVIGILEELKSADNVPAWIRGGGLTRLPSSVAPSDSAETSDAPTIESLPSHRTFRHWYAIPAVVAYWRDRGVQALQRKGIKVDPDVDMTNTSAGHRLGAQTGGPATHGCVVMLDHPAAAGGADQSGYMTDGMATGMMRLGMASERSGSGGKLEARGSGQAGDAPGETLSGVAPQAPGKQKKRQKKKAAKKAAGQAEPMMVEGEDRVMTGPDATLGEGDQKDSGSTLR